MNLLMNILEISCFTISRFKVLFRSEFLPEGIHTWRQNNPTEKLLKCPYRAFKKCTEHILAHFQSGLARVCL